jgi:hypothetical protein
MKQISTFKRFFAAALLVMAGASQAFANEYEIAWVKAEAYPTGAGLVYTDYANRDNDGNLISEDAMPFAATSEFKRSTNGAISDAYVWSKLTDSEYQLAGYARDTNKNGAFDNDTKTDKQVKVNYDGLFTCIQYPEKINGSSSSESAELAEEALNEKTEPSDLVFAVFTKGTIAVMKTGQENFGHVWASKLSNEPGEQIQFLAYSDSHESKYYKFDHWENAAGENIGTDRILTVTAQTKAVYYACVVETTKEDYLANEKDPHVSDNQSGEFPWESAIHTVTVNGDSSDAVYDLQGRRVAQPAKGLFIRDGKKIVIK